jgi:hypothetical protein
MSIGQFASGNTIPRIRNLSTPEIASIHKLPGQSQRHSMISKQLSNNKVQNNNNLMHSMACIGTTIMIGGMSFDRFGIGINNNNNKYDFVHDGKK